MRFNCLTITEQATVSNFMTSQRILECAEGLCAGRRRGDALPDLDQDLLQSLRLLFSCEVLLSPRQLSN